MDQLTPEANAESSAPELVVAHLCSLGFRFGAGVPCSLLGGFISASLSNPHIDYLGASNEAHALAITAGAALRGERTFVFSQNSGFFNLLDPLTSLNLTFEIPILLMISWRGETGIADVSHHDIAGRSFVDILRLLEIPFEKLPSLEGAALQCFQQAADYINSHRRPFAILVGADSFGSGMPEALAIHKQSIDATWPSRRQAIEALLAHRRADDVFFSTTGFIGRELYRLEDHPANVYVVGSMGLASSMALGCSLRNRIRSVVLDGDGSALMHLGAWSTIGNSSQANLLHIVFDNEAHESTGGQPTGSRGIDFSNMAMSMGYRCATKAESLGEFTAALKASAEFKGPSLIHLKVQREPGGTLPRQHLTPAQNAARAAGFLKNLRQKE